MRTHLRSALLAASLFAPAARAQPTSTWTGGATTDLWSAANPFNWSPSVLPPTTGIVAFVNPTPYQTVDLQMSRTVNSIQFGGPAAYTLTDGSLILSTGNLTVTGASASAVTHVINGAVALGANGTWSVDTSSLNVTGGITDGGSGFRLTKTGTGTLTLSGLNKYTGGTIVNGGTLAFGTNNALAAGTNVTVNAGASFDIAGESNTSSALGTVTVNGGTFSISNSVFSNTCVVNSISLTGGSVSLYNLMSLDLDLVGSQGIVSNSSGATSTIGTTSLINLVSRILNSSGAPTAINVAAGATSTGVDLDATALFSRAGSSTEFDKTGAGTMRLNVISGSTSRSTADFVVRAGRLRIDDPTALGTGRFALNGGTFTYGGSTGALATPINLDGNGTVEVLQAGTTLTASGVLSGPGALTTAGPGTVIITGTGSSIGALNVAAGAVLLQSGGTVNCGGTTLIGAKIGSTGSLTVTGTGSALTTSALNIGEANAPGQLTVAAGGAVTATGATTLANLASPVMVNGGTLTTGSLAVAGGVTPSILLTDPVGGAALTIGTGNSSTNYSGPIGDAAGGPGAVNKVGSGTLTLTGRLTNTGGYTASAGTIEFSGAVVQPGSGSLAAAAGATIQYDTGARVFGGFLDGPGTHVVTGGSTFSGAAASNSAIINVTGAATFTHFSNSGALSVAAGPTIAPSFSSFINQGSGSIIVGATSVVFAADFQSYGTLTINPAVVGSDQVTELMNTGTSPLSFNGGSRTFIGTAATVSQGGGLTFAAGIDLNGQNAVVAGGLFVNNGFVVDSSNNGAGTATVVADFGSLVKGAGFFQNPVITRNGGKFQAGNSPGSASFGNFVLGPGGVNSYVFAIDDATGTAGPHPNAAGQVSGWGLVSAVRQQIGATSTTGNFTWTADPADRLTLALDTLVNPTIVGTDVSGPMADFDPNLAYSWPAVRWAGSYFGPTNVAMLDAATSFDTTGFENPVNGTFGWNLDAADQTLSLIYTPTPVPEPGTLALVGLATAGLAYRRRRARPTKGDRDDQPTKTPPRKVGSSA